MKIKGFISRNRFVLASFFIPVILMILALAVTGVYPFGENQIAVIDMYHQYVPFLSELQYKLQEGGRLFYTWNGAGGCNFWNLMAYYGASPLNLLLALFPKTLIMEGITVILLIKIGLAGSFMAMYLRYIKGKNDWAITVFATLYAMCSYVMAYYWCIMWMDAVALLPLCILGLNRLMDDGRAVMYTVSLALVIVCNYYIAIMVCIFILCYYPALYFIKNRQRGWKHCALTTGKAVGFSLLGVFMSAVMLLPTYISMQDTYYISAEMPENLLFYNDALDVLNQLLPYSELTYRDGLPNLYCGMLIVMMLVFYMTERSVSLREKLINGAFLVFMFLSLNINKLDFIWHGLHFPNQLPYRYTFVICFVLISMAYKAFRRFGQVRIRTVWIVLFAGAAYYLAAQKLLTEHIDDMTLFFYGGMAWLLLYSAVMIIYKKKIIKRSAFALLIMVLVVSEMLSAACTAFDTIGNTLRSSYFENYNDMLSLAEESKKEFARTETDYDYILNCPALYHYRGISQFSSSINAGTTELMEKIGIEGSPGKNRFNYNQTNPVTNAILNIKYIITKTLPLEDDDFTLVKSSGSSGLYESRYPLSIGYMTGSEIRTWDTHSENPFEVLNSYVRAATSNKYDKVFKPVEESHISAENMIISSEANGKTMTEIEDKYRESSVVLSYTADKTQKYYVFIEADNAEEIFVNDRDGENDEIAIRNDCGSIINIGTVKAGETFDITVKFGAGDSGDITTHVCTLDYSVWDEVYDMISESTLQITENDDTHIKGTIDAGRGGVMVTSVPYDKGWTMKIDGRKTDIIELTGGVFISADLGEGSHEIELTFRPPGIITACLISLLAVLMLAAYTLLRKKRKKISFPKAILPSVSQEAEVFHQEGSDCNKI